MSDKPMIQIEKYHYDKMVVTENKRKEALETIAVFLTTDCPPEIKAWLDSHPWGHNRNFIYYMNVVRNLE